jgi:hypothetical protein
MGEDEEGLEDRIYICMEGSGKVQAPPSPQALKLLMDWITV